MAKATFKEKVSGVTRKIFLSNFPISKINDISFKSLISNVSYKAIFNLKSYSISKIEDINYKVKVEETLPFRVRFINIGIESYGPNNPAPIGIAVIGISNYIL
jgi:hypothetical protein